MNSFKMVKLGDLFEKPISGEWGVEPTENDKNSVGVIRTTNFSKSIKFKKGSEIVQRLIETSKVNKKKLINGDIIVEKSGGSPKQPVGRVLYYDLGDEKINLCNNFTSILRAKSGNDSKYCVYLLDSLYQKGSVLKFQNKTTGIINLKLDRYLQTIQIPLPPLPVQKKIVAHMDKAQELIDSRKEQIKLMDDLIQSTFYKMFGDPVTNPMGWEIKKLKDVCNKITSGKSVAGEAESEYKVINTSAVTYKVFDPSKSKNLPVGYIPPSNHLLKKHDLLVSRMNTKELVGAVALVDKDYDKLALPDRIWKLHLKSTDTVSVHYLLYILNHYSFRDKVTNVSTGTSGSMKNISQPKYLGLGIIYPPIELQNRFAERVEKIEAQKELMQVSLKEMEDNFNSIMQRAFKGEIS